MARPGLARLTLVTSRSATFSLLYTAATAACLLRTYAAPRRTERARSASFAGDALFSAGRNLQPATLKYAAGAARNVEGGASRYIFRNYVPAATGLLLLGVIALRR